MRPIILTISFFIAGHLLGQVNTSTKSLRPKAFVLVDSTIFFDGFDIDSNGDGRPDGWHINGNVVIDISKGVSGASMMLTGGVGGGSVAVSKTLTIEPYRSYRLSWWCSTEDVERYCSTGIVLGERRIEFEADYQGGTSEWQYHESFFTTKELEDSCRIVFWLESAAAWIDEVRLERFDKRLDCQDVIGECAGILFREGDSMAVWVNYPAMKIFREDVLSPIIPNTDTIRIRMAKNEYEPFQLVVHPASDIGSIYVTVSDLEGPETIPSDLVTINTVHYVWVDQRWILNSSDRGGYHPDALPWENQTCAPSDLHTPFWITIRTPEDIPAGTYYGEVEISGDLEFTFPLRVDVWNFAIPRISHIYVSGNESMLHTPQVGRFDKRSLQELFKDMAKNLISHRVMGTRYVANSLSTKDWLEIVGDSLHIDFLLFDETVEEYLGFGFEEFQIPPLPLASSRRVLGETKWLGLTPLTDRFNKHFIDYCERVGSHMAERGWLEKAFLFLWDEPSPSDYDSVYELYSLVRIGDDRLRLVLSEKPVDELYDVVDIWYPNLRRISMEEIMDRVEERKTAGKTVGGYGNNRYSMLYPLTYQRLWPWTLTKYGLTRMGWFSIISEGNGVSVWSDPVIRNKEDEFSTKLFPCRAFFIYFDREGDGPFVNSMRWEMLREGMEDVEYLFKLESLLNEFEPGRGGEVVRDLIDSLVIDNIGESYEKEISRVVAIRDSIGNWIDALEDKTGVNLKSGEDDFSEGSESIYIECYPNPFNESTKISIDSYGQQLKSVEIYDIRGRKILSRKMRRTDSRYEFYWDGKSEEGMVLPSGVYILICSHTRGKDYRLLTLIK